MTEPERDGNDTRPGPRHLGAGAVGGGVVALGLFLYLLPKGNVGDGMGLGVAAYLGALAALVGGVAGAWLARCLTSGAGHRARMVRWLLAGIAVGVIIAYPLTVAALVRSFSPKFNLGIVIAFAACLVVICAGIGAFVGLLSGGPPQEDDAKEAPATPTSHDVRLRARESALVERYNALSQVKEKAPPWDEAVIAEARRKVTDARPKSDGG